MRDDEAALTAAIIAFATEYGPLRLSTDRSHAAGRRVRGEHQTRRTDLAPGEVRRSSRREAGCGSMTDRASVCGRYIPIISGPTTSSRIAPTTGGSTACVDPATLNVVAEIAVGLAPRFMACTATDLWVLNQGDGMVSRIDTSSNQVVATIDAGVPGILGAPM
jgi:YVTN family beta-propeller protein